MTDRTVTAGVASASDALEYASFGFVALDFDTDPVYVWTGTRPFTATLPTETSHSYLGIGALGSIDGILESSDGSSNGVKLQMSGVADGLLANALGENYQGRSAKIWLVFLDADDVIIPDPIVLFSGQMDVMNLVDGDGQGGIEILCESRDQLLKRTSESLLTDEEQQRVYPGDLGLQFVMELQNTVLAWGDKGSSGNVPRGGSGGRKGQVNDDNEPDQ